MQTEKFLFEARIPGVATMPFSVGDTKHLDNRRQPIVSGEFLCIADYLADRLDKGYEFVANMPCIEGLGFGFLFKEKPKK